MKNSDRESFIDRLEEIDLPAHAPTYEAAIKGAPATNGRWISRPMDEVAARRLCRLCTFNMLMTRWVEAGGWIC